MQTTQKFKVGDIVRFKAEHEHYANRWSFPITNLKISKIEKEFYEDRTVSLLFIEGREGCVTSGVYDFRVELETSEKPNMFAFGKKNQKIKKLFLDYLVGDRWTGLCNFVFKNIKAEVFLKSQAVFEVNADTPVEYFILRSKKKSTKNAWDNYTRAACSHNDPSTPEGRLRIWWATNLAIAASQGKI